jgi:hypothetical protein
MPPSRTRRLNAMIGAGAITATLVAVVPGSSHAGTAATTPGCAEVTAFLDTSVGVIVAMSGGDPAPVAALLTAWPAQASAAVSVAPAEVLEPLTILEAAVGSVAAATEGVDLSGPDAADVVFAAMDSQAEADPAFEAVSAWATEQCGWSELGAESAISQAAEPAPCALLNPVVAADGAGLDSDLNLGASNVTTDVNLGSWWIKGCAYAGGALSLSSLGLGEGVDATEVLIESTVGAAILDGVDLGSLPASTLIYATDPVAPPSTETVPGSATATSTAMPQFVTVAVLEAPIPFLVTVTGDDIDAASVVAAAEAILETLPASLSVMPTL